MAGAYRPLVLYLTPREGDYRVTLGRGATRIWLNSFATEAEATVFTEQVASLLGVNQILKKIALTNET